MYRSRQNLIYRLICITRIAHRMLTRKSCTNASILKRVIYVKLVSNRSANFGCQLHSIVFKCRQLQSQKIRSKYWNKRPLTWEILDLAKT